MTFLGRAFGIRGHLQQLVLGAGAVSAISEKAVISIILSCCLLHFGRSHLARDTVLARKHFCFVKASTAKWLNPFPLSPRACHISNVWSQLVASPTACRVSLSSIAKLFQHRYPLFPHVLSFPHTGPRFSVSMLLPCISPRLRLLLPAAFMAPPR